MSDDTAQQKEDFYRGFVACLLWSTTEGDDGHLDDNHSASDLHPATAEGLRAQCDTFFDANAAELAEAFASPSGYDAGRAGHDFALTRNGHGSGFFDREDEIGTVCERLDGAARTFGQAEAYLGDDGKIYVGGLEPARRGPSAPGR